MERFLTLALTVLLPVSVLSGRGCDGGGNAGLVLKADTHWPGEV